MAGSSLHTPVEIAAAQGLGMLPMWTIYDHPSDYPLHFVVRSYLVNRGGEHDSHIALAETLEEARGLIPSGQTCLGRQPGDEPQIVETWI